MPRDFEENKKFFNSDFLKPVKADLSTEDGINDLFHYVKKNKIGLASRVNDTKSLINNINKCHFKYECVYYIFH